MSDTAAPPDNAPPRTHTREPRHLARMVTIWLVLCIVLVPLFWFLAKAGLLIFVFIWVRGTLPRFRYDQLMAFGWKFLLPLAIANIVVTALVVALRS